MQYLEAGMKWLLELFHGWTGSYGLAVILLTVGIRLLLWPLMAPQFKVAAKMRMIQPKVAALQEKYRDRPEEMQRRLLQLYKEEKVNPFSGCLPILLQMPFLWALYNMLRVYQFEHGFLWLHNLRAPDPFYILPVLSGLTTYLQNYISGSATNDPTTKGMTAMMPLLFAAITATLPAGVALYWVTSTVFSIGQQWVVSRPLVGQVAGEGEGGRRRGGRAAGSGKGAEGGESGPVR
ncbi:MAG TPA: membrane protein insertase YidC [Firmicutes bacterium]|nr:membrane protein insertase YidC [Bacillota bacterium]